MQSSRNASTLLLHCAELEADAWFFATGVVAIGVAGRVIVRRRGRQRRPSRDLTAD